MKVDGYWEIDKTGAARPVLKAGMMDAGGRPVEVTFLIDTGSDRTVLDYQTLIELGPDVEPTDEYLHGVGGRVDAVAIDVPILFQRSDGQTVLVRGPFLASPDPAALGPSVLGRDVLDNFALIVDRHGDIVTLLHAPHRYIVLDA